MQTFSIRKKIASGRKGTKKEVSLIQQIIGRFIPKKHLEPTSHNTRKTEHENMQSYSRKNRKLIDWAERLLDQ